MALVAVCAVAAAGRPNAKAAWSRTFSAGIDWVAEVGEGTSAALLVCDGARKLWLIDPATGTVRSGQAADAAGVFRLADHPRSDARARYVCCFGPFAIGVLSLDHPAEFRWQRGDESPPAHIEGDPETIPRWTHAALTDAGVIAVNDQGRVVLLDLHTGRPKWTRDLARRAASELVATASHAAVVQTRGDHGAVTMMNLATHRSGAPLELPGAAPVWSGLWGKTFACVSDDTLHVLTDGGDWRRVKLGEAAYRTRIAAWQGTGTTTAPADPLRGSLLLIAGRTRLRAYGLPKGELRWVRPLPGTSANDGVVRVSRGGRYVAWMKLGELRVFALPAGRPVRVPPIDGLDDARQVIWTAEHVILATAQRISAYELGAAVADEARPTRTNDRRAPGSD